MYSLIGDIGNTITKVCLIELRTFKIIKIVYFNSIKINSNAFLRQNMKKIIKNKNINRFALFSSVVPKYHCMFKKFLKKNIQDSIKRN